MQNLVRNTLVPTFVLLLWMTLPAAAAVSEGGCSADEARSGVSAEKGQTADWAEPEGLEEAGRLAWRPGNYACLEVMVSYLDGLYSLRPRLQSVAYPFYDGSNEILDESEYERMLEKTEKRAKDADSLPVNTLRAYTLHFESIAIRDCDESEDVLTAGENLGVGEYAAELLAKAVAKHPGKSVLVRARILSKSLQSDKVEGDDSYEWFLFAYKEDTDSAKKAWKIVLHMR